MAAETSKSKKWLPLEANPTVMAEFLRKLGLPLTVDFYDVYGFDDELLAMVPPNVLSVLFLFPADDKTPEKTTPQSPQSLRVWFTLQTVRNACGTVALLHSVGNNGQQIKLESGSWLQKFFRETANSSPEERAGWLERDTEMESAHTSAAGRGDTAAPDISNPVDLHFVAFVCVEDTLFELDGSKSGPQNHGATSPQTLLKDSVKIIQKVVAKNPESVQFNVIAMAIE